MTWWRCASLFVVLAALMLPPSQVRAQATTDPGDLRIRVLDASGQPVVAAEVVLGAGKRRDHSARTDSTGVVTIGGLEPGLWSLTVRRLGLTPVTASVRVEGGRNEVTVEASVSALTLTGVRIAGGVPYASRLDDFERRRLAGDPSAVVTRQEIERRDPIALSRMLRGVAGIRIGDSSGYTVAMSSRGMKPTRAGQGIGFGMVPCVMRVAIDGTLMPALFNLDQIVPRDVYGIEVFNGPARIPRELSGQRTDSWCGLIAIWTRDR